MGFFTKKTHEEKQAKQEASVYYPCQTLQPIGKIPINGICKLTLKPSERVLNIHCGKSDITLPYERLRSFEVNDEVTLAKSGSGLGGAIVGGALFGGAGAIVGQNMKKGKTKIKWIATLTYEDKEGTQQQLNFLETGTGDHKSLTAISFEATVNRIASDCGEEITEL